MRTHLHKGVAAVACVAALLLTSVSAFAQGKVFETSNDFSVGILISLNNDNDRLTFTGNAKPLPFMWVPTGRGTMTRVETETGTVLGEYAAVPAGMVDDVRRVAVDNLGNCWIGMFDERDNSCSGAIGQSFNGSVTRIGVIIGGTRVNADGTPNPSGEYLAPPYDYTTCFDRDGDGLLRTSLGLADVKAWTNAGQADTCGGVSTADDEAILNFVRIETDIPRTLTVDARNDLWIAGPEIGEGGKRGEGGGKGGKDFIRHEKVSGVIGVPIPSATFTGECGGDAAVVGPDGRLWSFQNDFSFLAMRYDPQTGDEVCFEIDSFVQSAVIHPITGRLWYAALFEPIIRELDGDGNVLQVLNLGGFPHDFSIDSNGEIWVAENVNFPEPPPTDGGFVERWVPDGGGVYSLFSTIQFQNPSIISVDQDGMIWVNDIVAGTLSRIDPAGGNPVAGPPPGAVDLVVDVGGAGAPLSNGDGTGFGVLSGASNQGSWTAIYDSEQANTPWGTARWDSIEPTGTSVRAKVRAAENLTDLASTPFVDVDNGVSFSGVQGRYIEMQVALSRDFGIGERPVLDRFEIEASECHMLVGEAVGSDIYRFGDNSHVFQTRLRNIYKSYPVLMEDIPTITLHLPSPSAVTSGVSRTGANTGAKPWRTFHVQIVMWNPVVFPENSEQSTPGLRIDVYADGTVKSRRFGEADGDMDLEVEVKHVGDGLIELTVPFVVGME